MLLISDVFKIINMGLKILSKDMVLNEMKACTFLMSNETHFII